MSTKGLLATLATLFFAGAASVDVAPENSTLEFYAHDSFDQWMLSIYDNEPPGAMHLWCTDQEDGYNVFVMMVPGDHSVAMVDELESASTLPERNVPMAIDFEGFPTVNLDWIALDAVGGAASYAPPAMLDMLGESDSVVMQIDGGEAQHFNLTNSRSNYEALISQCLALREGA